MSPSRTRRNDRRFVPEVAALEDRTVPTAFVNAWGDIEINQTNGNDSARVSFNGASYVVLENLSGSVVTRSFARSQVWGSSIWYRGFGGNDTFQNLTGLRTVADGGPGNDSLWSGFFAGDNWLNGGSGNDTLVGGSGQDNLYGEGDRDSLYGNGGDDHLDGGAGDGQADHLQGDSGADSFKYDPAKGKKCFLWVCQGTIYNRDEPVDLNNFDVGYL